MGETAYQIESHIEQTRHNLGSNLDELEQKVKSATDWRQHFQTMPMTMIGVALGGGILLAAMTGGHKRRRGERAISSNPPASESRSFGSQVKQGSMQTFDHLKDALVGVAAVRLKDLVEDLIPGFRDQYQRAEDKAKSNRYNAS